jgi:hypothetical protein
VPFNWCKAILSIKPKRPYKLLVWGEALPDLQAVL